MHEYITYLRVSTQEQRHSGLGIEAQRQLVNDHIQQYEGTLIQEFIDYESGRKISNDDRPSLHLALHMLHNYPKAKLLIARTDRIARDLHFISGLLKDKVPLIVAGHENMSKLEWHMHAMIAEHEADLISQRTKQALAQAKARGVQLGPPKNALSRIQHKGTNAYVQMTADHRAKVRQVVDQLLKDESMFRITTGKLNRYKLATKLNELGVKTVNNKVWNYNKVSEFIKMEKLHDQITSRR